MGIGPITNLTPLVVTRAVEADVEPVSMKRVEDSSRTKDETYSPSDQQASSSPDDTEEEVPVVEIPEDAAEPDDGQAEGSSEPRINFLA
jgi:hypothetical protein